MSSLSVASADFALNLFRAATEPERNAFLSPMSISLAVGMAYAGADGATARQIKDGLFKGVNDTEIHEGMSKVLQVLVEPNNEYQLHTANRIYGQDGFSLQKEFVTILTKYYQSQLHAVDFKSDGENVREEINKFVEEITNNRIKNLLAPGVLSAETRLVLVNAMYFKGDWAHKFKESETREAVFYSAKGEETKVQMMHQVTNERYYLQYFENDEMQILGMPYIGAQLDMFIFLPRDRYGIENLELKINGKYLMSLIDGMRIAKVVDLPKFKLEQQFSLNSALAKLGIHDMFVAGAADFSKISGT